MTIDEMIAVLQAAKAGKPIESRLKSSIQPFTPISSGSGIWDFYRYEYRVKPAEPREWRIHDYGTSIMGVPQSAVRGSLFSDRHYDITVREVLPSPQSL